MAVQCFLIMRSLVLILLHNSLARMIELRLTVFNLLLKLHNAYASTLAAIVE